MMLLAMAGNGHKVNWKEIAKHLSRTKDGELRSVASLRHKYHALTKYKSRAKNNRASTAQVEEEEAKPKGAKLALSIDDAAEAVDTASAPGSPSQSPTMGLAPTLASKWVSLPTIVEKRICSLFGRVTGLDAATAAESAPAVLHQPFFAPTMSEESNFSHKIYQTVDGLPPLCGA